MTQPSADENADYRAALDFLYDRIDYERTVVPTSRYPFRLNRIRELLRRLGLSDLLYSPVPSAMAATDQTILVHIAGTKGKGSTASMVAAALSASGTKTGLYTSPHLHHLEERFRIDGEVCGPGDLVRLVDRVRPVDQKLIDEGKGAASFFDLTTALALLHFHTSGCDAIVLETGLGGRLDSTNVCRPDVTAITSIGLDHQHVLGDTLEKIAAEKAGIIKPGVPIISGVVAGEPAGVIQTIAADQDSTLYQIDRDFSFSWKASDGWGSVVDYQGHAPPLAGHVRLKLSLEGQHQAKNAALAIAILKFLQHRRRIAWHDVDGSRAFSQLQFQGRVEPYFLANRVLGIVDAAHNEDSIAALCECLRRRAVGRPLAVVMGTSIDKSAGAMLGLIARLASKVDLRSLVLTRFRGNPRGREPAELISLVPESIRPQTIIVDEPIAACEAALQSVTPGGCLVVCGSFFLAAETRGWMNDRRDGDWPTKCP